MYTTSSIFLQTLSAAGITHAFVNWGSDHPGLLEDLERQRTENHATQLGGDHASDSATTKPAIITCPNEMVALSAAQGYAQVTGNPAAVIVHVDVGTQVGPLFSHVDDLSIDCYFYRTRRWQEPFTIDRSRTPVLIYAGASPFSSEGEHKATRNELCGYKVCIPIRT